jgi:hypothetical protein
MAMSDPRLRALLRQAERSAASGKRAAARQLFEEVLEEAPENIDAILGLASVTRDAADQRALYERVLVIEPGNELAMEGLRDGTGPQTIQAPARDVGPPATEPDETMTGEEPGPPVLIPEVPETHETLFCYRHPDRPTGLRCYTCHRPICMKCAKRTPVGYRCPDCIREAQDVFFSAGLLDYVLAAVVTLILGLLAGLIVPRLGFFVIFLAPAVGTGIGRVAFRVAGRRRGRWLPHLVAAMVVAGGLLPFLPLLLGGGSLFALLWPGLYLLLATGSAYYQVR